MTQWIARVLATAAVGWSVGLGIWLWVTPYGTQSFAEASALGPIPLLIPVLLAAIAAWAIWRRRILPAALAAGLLLVFVILAGFSIGAGYVPAVAGLIWAFVALAES